MPNDDSDILEWAQREIDEAAAASLRREIDAALDRYDQVVARLDIDELDQRDLCLLALCRKGELLVYLDRLKEAEDAFNTAFSGAAAAGLVPPDRARLTEAVFLAVLRIANEQIDESHNAAAAALAEIALAGLGAARLEDDTTLRDDGALVKAGALINLHRESDAAVLLQPIVARLGSDVDAEHRRQVASALLYRGHSLAKAGRIRDALATYDALIARYGDDTSRKTRKVVGDAMRKRAALLRGLSPAAKIRRFVVQARTRRSR
jgi:tetratricopeptide (TPR) repeat protein